ncbi:MAG: pyridoxamine 5'-phosphate oxidase [Actinobacteria bacterium]|nr:pyridoxamine 5'-phosphate oxidase [Actinomycetota bacterium]
MSEPPHSRPLRRSELAAKPLEQFRRWFDEARAAGIRQPEAAALATASAAGAPSVRMVLLKGFDAAGFAFYTSYDGRKARELAANPLAALLVYWEPLGRQVRVEGGVARVSREESGRYFSTRPRGSRLGAWASRQSEPIASRRELEAAVGEAEHRLGGRDVPLPPGWGGFRLAPVAYEFWQHRDDRLHDRFLYTRAAEGWAIERLSP